MKLLYFFSILLLVSCASVPKDFLVSNTICHYNDAIFKITEDEMYFDIKKYDKGRGLLIDNKNFKSRYRKFSNESITNYKTDKQLNIGKWVDYYSDGKIKSVSFLYLNGTKRIGKETHYDTQGNIEKVIDYEKGYTICWAEAIEIIKKIAKKDIKKYQIDTFYLLRTNLNEFPESTPRWTVSMEGNDVYNEKDDKSYVIDGVTGKLIRTYTVKVIYDSLDE